MKVKKVCPFCGKETELYVNDENYEAFCNGINITEALTDLDLFGREVLISGMCYSCQEKTFHKPLPQHAKAWGEMIGECNFCGTPIYEKEDLTPDGSYKCPQCDEVYQRGDFNKYEDS